MWPPAGGWTEVSGAGFGQYEARSTWADAVVPTTIANAATAAAASRAFRRLRDQFKGIPQSGRVLGRSDAPVTMVEFADLQCPFCAQYAQDALPTVVSRYIRAGKLKLELRLIAIIGPDSGKARRMAAAAQRQNRLWNFAELFYRNQGEENSGYVTDPFL